MPDIPHLLLAAGNSNRMGQPKQLLPWGAKTLIEHQIQIRLQTGQTVIVVLGGNADKIQPVIEKLPVKVVINTEWAKGMGNSLAFGVEKLSKEFAILDGVLISLIDQPLITTAHFEKMLSSFKTGTRQIIVSQAASGWRGAPVLFDHFYFEELRKLKGQEGAKVVIQKYNDSVITVECGNLLEDIDNPEAYQQLLKISNTTDKL